MRILLIGDSITAGKVGVNWSKKLSLRHPDWLIENAGVNGETISLIGDRLSVQLKRDARYHAIVIQAGTNDILIPALRSKGFLYKKAADYLVRKGYRPIQDQHYFEKKLRFIITRTRLQSRAKIILATIACVNEKQDSETNKYRLLLNEVIRFVAHDTQCELADVGLAFDHYLSQRLTRNFILPGFCTSTFIDPLNCRLGHADQLTRDRRLHLTIDGVHLNSKGASIFTQEVERTIQHVIPLGAARGL